MKIFMCMLVLAAVALAEEKKSAENVKQVIVVKGVEQVKDSKQEKRGLLGLGYGAGHGGTSMEASSYSRLGHESNHADAGFLDVGYSSGISDYSGFTGGHGYEGGIGANYDGSGSSYGKSGYSSAGFGGSYGPNEGVLKQITYHREVAVPVPHPVPVKIEKTVPVPVKVPITIKVDRPVPYKVETPVPYLVEKPVPYPVERPIPYPVKVPVRVEVPQPYPVKVEKPYPVTVERKVPIPVLHPVVIERKVPVHVHHHDSLHYGTGLGHAVSSAIGSYGGSSYSSDLGYGGSYSNGLGFDQGVSSYSSGSSSLGSGSSYEGYSGKSYGGSYGYESSIGHSHY